MSTADKLREAADKSRTMLRETALTEIRAAIRALQSEELPTGTSEHQVAWIQRKHNDGISLLYKHDEWLLPDDKRCLSRWNDTAYSCRWKEFDVYNNAR